MQRQRIRENDRQQTVDDGPSVDDNLHQQRTEVDRMLQAANQVFDSINDLQAQQYLEQNLQTGGQ